MNGNDQSISEFKTFKSNDYSFVFNRKNGNFVRFGKNLNDDPDFSPIGPEIADIEISTICHGINDKPCSWCYKSNTAVGENMSFQSFKEIFDKLPKTLTQIAFGIGDLSGNLDLWKIMEYCRENDVIPNITINGWKLNDKLANKLKKLCGAVAISHYNNDNICFGSVQKLTKIGMKQINIHKLLSNETYDSCFKLIDKTTIDERLKKLNAIVFLMLKPKGKRNILTQLKSIELYKNLIEYAFKRNVRIGFDSCSAHMFLESVKDNENYNIYKTFAEPCESTCFSIYINTQGNVFPCSFCEGEKDWENGIDLKQYNSMLEVWNSEKLLNWRNKLLANGRKCPMFDLNSSSTTILIE